MSVLRSSRVRCINGPSSSIISRDVSAGNRLLRLSNLCETFRETSRVFPVGSFNMPKRIAGLPLIRLMLVLSEFVNTTSAISLTRVDVPSLPFPRDICSISSRLLNLPTVLTGNSIDPFRMLPPGKFILADSRRSATSFKSTDWATSRPLSART